MTNIYWSEMAQIDYWNTIDYLEKEWTLNEVYQFMDAVTAVIALLFKANVTFKPTAFKNTFQVPVVKQITLYYRFENNNIELLRFWNNHQNPKAFGLKKNKK